MKERQRQESLGAAGEATSLSLLTPGTVEGSQSTGDAWSAVCYPRLCPWSRKFSILRDTQKTGTFLSPALDPGVTPLHCQLDITRDGSSRVERITSGLAAWFGRQSAGLGGTKLWFPCQAAAAAATKNQMERSGRGNSVLTRLSWLPYYLEGPESPGTEVLYEISKL